MNRERRMNERQTYAGADVFPQIWQNLTAEALARLLAPHRPKIRNRTVLFECPRCGKPEAYVYSPKDGKGPSLHCNRKNNCGYVLSVFDFVKEREDGDGARALKALAEMTDVSLETRTAAPGRRFPRPVTDVPSPSRILAAPVLEGMERRQAVYQDAFAASPACAYIRQRGLTLDEALAMSFGYAQTGLLAGRLTYPLRNRAGRIVAFEGRLLKDTLEDHEKKCLCDGIKSEGVFLPGGAFRRDDLVLCEGPFDAAALALTGLNAVATCGAENFPSWLLRACAFRSVTLAFDADPAGDGAVRKRTLSLREVGALVSELRPPPSRDWGDMLREGREALRTAVRAVYAFRSMPPSSALSGSGTRVTLPGCTETPFALSQGPAEAFAVGFDQETGSAAHVVSGYSLTNTLTDPDEIHRSTSRAKNALCAVLAAVEGSASVPALTRLVRTLIAHCDLSRGYTDADDPFAGDVIPALHLYLDGAHRLTPEICASLRQRAATEMLGV